MDWYDRFYKISNKISRSRFDNSYECAWRIAKILDADLEKNPDPLITRDKISTFWHEYVVSAAQAILNEFDEMIELINRFEAVPKETVIVLSDCVENSQNEEVIEPRNKIRYPLFIQ